MDFYTRFNPPPQQSIKFLEPSMTEQHFKDECDINTIVSRYQETGVLPQGNREPLFGDFTEFPTDLQSSQQFFDEAHARFMELPSNLRKEFNNDPVQLLAFLHDENNRARAVELGLIAGPASASPAPQTSANVQSERTNVETPPVKQAET